MNFKSLLILVCLTAFVATQPISNDFVDDLDLIPRAYNSLDDLIDENSLNREIIRNLDKIILKMKAAKNKKETVKPTSTKRMKLPFEKYIIRKG